MLAFCHIFLQLESDIPDLLVSDLSFPETEAREHGVSNAQHITREHARQEIEFAIGYLEGNENIQQDNGDEQEQNEKGFEMFGYQALSFSLHSPL